MNQTDVSSFLDKGKNPMVPRLVVRVHEDQMNCFLLQNLGNLAPCDFIVFYEAFVWQTFCFTTNGGISCLSAYVGYTQTWLWESIYELKGLKLCIVKKGEYFKGMMK